MNLFPDVPSQTVRGVTYTRTGDHQWRVAGVVENSYSNAGSNVVLEPGVYRLASTVSNGNGIVHVQVQKPDGSWLTDKGEMTVTERASCRCQIAANDTTSQQIDATVSDVSLVRID